MTLRTTLHLVSAAGLAASILTGCGAAGTRGRADAPGTPKERTVALQGSNGTYMSCDLVEGDPLRERLLCKSPYIGAWEKFTLVDLGEGRAALRATNGKYVASELGEGAYLVANRDAVGPFETFALVRLEDGRITLKADNGRYVGAVFSLPGDSAGLLYATSADAMDAQRFRLIEDPQY